MNDVSELFDRDPCGLSDQNIDAIVIRMRQNQAQFELGIKPERKTAPKKSTKTMDLLRDLGLT